jgi:hypothetical protein
MIGGATTSLSGATTSLSGATSIDEMLAACSVEALDDLDDQSLLSLAAEVVGLWPRLEAARLRVIAAVDSRGAYRVDGVRDMTSWLAWRAGDRRDTARREVELAEAVTAMPAVEAGLADGTLSKAKAVELGRLVDAPAEDQDSLSPSPPGSRPRRWPGRSTVTS